MSCFSIQHVEPADVGNDAAFALPQFAPSESGLDLPPLWATVWGEMARAREGREAAAYQQRYGRAAGWDVDYAYTNGLALEDLPLVCQRVDLPLFCGEGEPVWWPEREGGRVAFWANPKDHSLAYIDLLTGYWRLRLVRRQDRKMVSATRYGADLNDLVALRRGGKRAGAAWAIARWFGTEPWRFRRIGA